MAEKEIVWSELAKLQLTNILDFYIQRNGNSRYSLSLLNELESLLFILSKHEQIGRITSNNITRVIPMKVYLIFYEVNGNQIEILSIWDNRQDIENRKIK